MLKYIPDGLEALDKFQKEQKEFDKYKFLDSLPSELSEKLNNIVFENEVDFYSYFFDDYIDERIKEIEDSEKFA